MEYIINIIYIAIAVVGWVVAHYFTSRRDRNNKCRELRIKYLIEAYEVLCCEISNRPPSNERARLIEDMVAKVQLIGTDNQIKLAKRLCKDICNKEEFPFDDLINDLRNDLRNNLGLSEIEENVAWVRMSNKSD